MPYKRNNFIILKLTYNTLLFYVFFNWKTWTKEQSIINYLFSDYQTEDGDQILQIDSDGHEVLTG